MNPNEVPTKGNLMRAKNSLTLARQGYDLMDKKRNILIRELTTHIEKAKELQSQIDVTYREASSVSPGPSSWRRISPSTRGASWGRRSRWSGMNPRRAPT